MGRGDELADRFEADSLRLAALEVRQRMAGRWVMASIQTSFAIMPAAVYWFGGLALAHGSTAVSIPMLVAFTTLQTRLFFPVGSLLGVGLDVQTSLALFDRIFEYLDQPIDIEEKPDALAVGQRRRRRLRSRLVSVRRRLDAPGRLVHRGRRHDDRARRRDRLGQDHARLPRGASVRRQPRAHHDRRRRHPRPELPGAVRPRRGRLAGDVPLPRVDAREPALRQAGRDRRGDRGGRRGCTHPPRDRGAARGIRHRRRRARLSVLRRREAADRDCAHDPAQPADPRARRGDELARHRDRAARPGGARPAFRGADDDRDRAPALDRARRRPDHRARPWPRRRVGQRTTT